MSSCRMTVVCALAHKDGIGRQFTPIQALTTSCANTGRYGCSL